MLYFELCTLNFENILNISARGGRRSLPDRLGQSGDGDVERDEDVVNKSVMSRVVKVFNQRIVKPKAHLGSY